MNIILNYSVPKLSYGPFALIIKMFTTSHTITHSQGQLFSYQAQTDRQAERHTGDSFIAVVYSYSYDSTMLVGWGDLWGWFFWVGRPPPPTQTQNNTCSTLLKK